jgi:hypothetical protein
LRASPRADEQLALQRLFKNLDLFGQRWLGHAQTPGSTTEVLFLGHGKKEPQMAQQAKVDHHGSIGAAYQILRGIGIYRTIGESDSVGTRTRTDLSR